MLTAGLLLGGIYALMAFGLTIIFGTAGMINVAHGLFIVLGGLVSFWLVGFGLDPFITLLILVPLFFTIGVLYQIVFIRRLMAKCLEPAQFAKASILVTLGVTLAGMDLYHLLQKSTAEK